MIFFLMLMFLAFPLMAAPYELGSGTAIVVTVRADVVNYEEEIMDTASCNYETNEACQNIITVAAEDQ